MRKGSTSVGACEVRCWRWLFGNKIPISLLPPPVSPQGTRESSLLTSCSETKYQSLHEASRVYCHSVDYNPISKSQRAPKK